MANISIDELSLTIAELVDLDPKQQSTIESAVTRAISAKNIVGGQVASRTIPTVCDEKCLHFDRYRSYLSL